MDKLRSKHRKNRKGYEPVFGEPVFPYKTAQSAAETASQKNESLILERYSENSSDAFRPATAGRGEAPKKF